MARRGRIGTAVMAALGLAVIGLAPAATAADGDVGLTITAVNTTENSPRKNTVTYIPGDQYAYMVDVPNGTNKAIADFEFSVAFPNGLKTINGPKSTTSNECVAREDVPTTFDCTVKVKSGGALFTFNGKTDVAASGTLTATVTQGGLSASADLKDSRSFSVDAATLEPTEVKPGAQVTMTLTIKNTGPADFTANSPARFSDLILGIPDTAILTKINNNKKLTDSPTWKESGVSLNWDSNASKLTWSGPLAVDAEPATVTFTFTVAEGAKVDETVLQTVTTDDNGSCGVCSSKATVAATGYTVSLESDPETVNPGDTVDYVLTVKNNEDVDLKKVNTSVSIDLTDVLKFAKYQKAATSASIGSVSFADETTDTPNVLSWSGKVPANETAIVKFSVKVKAKKNIDSDEGHVDLIATAVPGTAAGSCIGDSCVATTKVTLAATGDSEEDPADSETTPTDTESTTSGGSGNTKGGSGTGTTADSTTTSTDGSSASASGTASGSAAPSGTGTNEATVTYPTGSSASAGVTVSTKADHDSVVKGETIVYTSVFRNNGPTAYTDANPAIVVTDLSGVLDDATYNNDAVATTQMDSASIAQASYAKATKGQVVLAAYHPAQVETVALAAAAPTLGFTFDATAQTLTWAGALDVGKAVKVTYTVTVNKSGDGVLPNGCAAGGSSCETIANVVAAAADSAAAATNTGFLAQTGAQVGAAAGLGALLIGGGVVLLVARRRRINA